MTASLTKPDDRRTTVRPRAPGRRNPRRRGWCNDSDACLQSRFSADLARRLFEETGTRLLDWINHFTLPDRDPFIAELSGVGYSSANVRAKGFSEHPRGIEPADSHRRREERQLISGLNRSSISWLLRANFHCRWPPQCSVRRWRRQTVVSLGARWHASTHSTPTPDEQPVGAILTCGSVRPPARRRLMKMKVSRSRRSCSIAPPTPGRDRACELFFVAEREYWLRRNRAGRIQKARQDAMGLGWANHDHHTYRSGREHFARLIEILERMGFSCRERFYAGREAGWGAQVLDHPTTGVVIFADVDLAPEEVSQDFSHEPLAPRDQLGTVGLWCKLHGEAFLEAGMHHLECQFDFNATRDQLRAAGIETMPPFTDLPYLRQAFTRGEQWPVAPNRVERLRSAKLITDDQARQFSVHGALGSHMEILQRDDGYKGFNQSGINEIIAATDPRRAARSEN